MSAAYETARDFATHGYAVLPTHSVRDGRCTCSKPDCDQPGKHPRTLHGVKDATTDERQLLHWHERHPEAGWAVACGDRVSVVDIDSKAGADPREIIDEHDLIGPIVWTGEATDGPLEGVRGAHIYCASGTPTGNGRVAGVEVRGAGAYVILPGSRHVSGVSYQWAGDGRPWTAELASVPAALGPKLSPTGFAPAVPTMIAVGSRHSTLMSLAGTMRRRGMGEAEIGAALLVANRDRCQRPLDDEEVRKIAKSAVRYEPAEPASRNGPPAGDWLEGSPMDPCAASSDPLPPLAGFPFLHEGMAAIISGPTGKGRSSLIQACAYDAARAGLRVAYLGGEVTELEFNARAAMLAEKRFDNAEQARDDLSRARFLDLSATLAFAWKNPERWIAEAGALYDVVIIDPLNDALAATGAGHENADYIAFYTRLIEPLRTHAVAVAMLDNVGHAQDAQGRPMGASAKMHKADLTFSCSAQDEPLLLRLTAGKVRSVRAAFRKGATWECDELTQRITTIDPVFAVGRKSRQQTREEEDRANVIHALTDDEQSLKGLERVTGIVRTTLRRRLLSLEGEGLAMEGDAGWVQRPRGGPTVHSLGVGHLDPPLTRQLEGTCATCSAALTATPMGSICVGCESRGDR